MLKNRSKPDTEETPRALRGTSDDPMTQSLLAEVAAGVYGPAPEETYTTHVQS